MTVPAAVDEQGPPAIPWHELPELLDSLRREMRDAARELDFERAAELRDRIRELEAEQLRARLRWSSRERAEALPNGPGVYLFKTAAGRVLYVGKAQNLRARVRSYLGGGDGRPRIPLLVERSDDVDVVVTASVKDALLLENELIKRHKPPFNVRLRDDKQYLALRLDPRETWPRLTQVRRFRRDGACLLRPLHLEHRHARVRLEPAPDLPAALLPRGRLPRLRAARAPLHRVRDEALPGTLLRARLARGLRRAGARHGALPARPLGGARRDAAGAHAGGRGGRALRGRGAPAQPDPGGRAHRRAPADGDAASDRSRRVRARAAGRRDRGAGAARARRTRDGRAGLRLLRTCRSTTAR